MPVVVYAVVEVMAVPTVPDTVWAAGVMVVFADTVALPIGIATEAQTTENIVMRRFMGVTSWCLPTVKLPATRVVEIAHKIALL